MSRIKFKAWEVKEQRMLYPGSFDIHSYHNGEYGISHQFIDEPERVYRFTRCKRNGFDNTKPEVILLQFTGLKDKNDIEIYEGDILEYGTKYIGYVMFENCGFHLVKSKGKQIIHLSVLNNIKVIGNIYPNPELLEVIPDD